MSDPYVRVDVWSLAENDPIITAYANAVAAMKQKDPSDPASWAFQAGMHGTYLNSPPTPPANQCQHYSWFFLPWHRMFVYYFEQIVRAQVIANGGPPTWALPYWNYDGGGQSNKLPPAFRDSSSPLYTAKRVARINDGTAGLPTGPHGITSAWQAFDLPTFTGTGEFGGGATPTPIQFFIVDNQSQQGQLEITPHDAVHDVVGGQSGLMADPNTAAQDPIFWLHHANIDRLWWLWEQQPQNSDPSDSTWLNQNFLSEGGFFDASGHPVQGSSVLTCGAVENVGQLGYTYDKKVLPSPGPAAPAAAVRMSWPSPWPERPQIVAGPGTPRHLVGATERQIRLTGETVTVPVAIDDRSIAPLRAAGSAGEQQHRVFLDIEQIDAERNPGLVYGVFVNLPAQPTDADLDSHFAGNLSLFGIEAARNPRGDEHPHSLRISMDITRLLDRLAANGTWTDGHNLEVTFRPTPLEAPSGQDDLARELAETAHPDLPITIGRVSVHYA
jgi:Common central domain of tyrosinase